MSNNSYLGNENLKAAGVKVNWTPEQLDEYIKCSQDPVYFIRNYIKIINLDKGLVDFNMYPFQEEMVKKIHNNRFTIAVSIMRQLKPHSLSYQPKTFTSKPSSLTLVRFASKYEDASV